MAEPVEINFVYIATYKRITRLDLKIPSRVSPEAKDLIQKVSEGLIPSEREINVNYDVPSTSTAPTTRS